MAFWITIQYWHISTSHRMANISLLTWHLSIQYWHRSPNDRCLSSYLTFVHSVLTYLNRSPYEKCLSSYLTYVHSVLTCLNGRWSSGCSECGRGEWTVSYSLSLGDDMLPLVFLILEKLGSNPLYAQVTHFFGTWTLFVIFQFSQVSSLVESLTIYRKFSKPEVHVFLGLTCNVISWLWNIRLFCDNYFWKITATSKQ